MKQKESEHLSNKNHEGPENKPGHIDKQQAAGE